MILLIADQGCLQTALQEAVEGMGEHVRSASSQDADLFMSALGCSTILYAPERSLFEANANPKPSPDRMRAVVRAAQAPGVKLVIVVEPLSDSYAAEEDVLVRDGVPYVILRSAPLLEEVAEGTSFQGSKSIWLPRGQRVELATAESLRASVADAFTRDDVQGRTVQVPAENLELGEWVRRAASLAGVDVRVHVAAPGVSKAMRKLSSWFGYEQPDLGALAARVPESASQAEGG